MKILEVLDKKSEREFILFPVRLYKDDPNYIRPLDVDIEKVFDPVKNKKLRNGFAKRWLLLNEQNETIGKVAAFYEKKDLAGSKLKSGGLGFFDCINDQTAANTLFQTAIEWLKENGLEAVDGPINFGERNAWWGCLVEGFTEPTYQMNYNFPYYQELFENFGFQLYFKQLSFGLKRKDAITGKYYKKAYELDDDPDYSFKAIKKSQLKKFAEDFTIIYNKAWAGHPGTPKMDSRIAYKMFQTMKPVMVEHLTYFGYYKGEPIGFYVNLPELNQYFKYVNGKLDWLGKLKYLYHKFRKTNRKFFGVIFGVVPEHQKKGVEGALILAADRGIPEDRWDDIELIWIGDFNPKMITIAKNLGCQVNKTHHTYRFLFDRNAPFERHPIFH